MRIHTAPRQAGKTRKAIEQAFETGAYIVCNSAREAQRVHAEASRLGMHIAQPITHDDFINRRYGPRCRGFIIEDAELLLSRMAGPASVDMITLTTPPEETEG